MYVYIYIVLCLGYVHIFAYIQLIYGNNPDQRGSKYVRLFDVQSRPKSKSLFLPFLIAERSILLEDDAGGTGN